MAKRDLRIKQRPIDSLIPYTRNARTHSDEQVEQIAASIREFGWTNPVLVDGKNGIIGGHGRVLAAKLLGEKKVPCIELAGMSESETRAYILADNKLAENAGWDDELLRLELGDLEAEGFDLSLIGFGELELESLLADRTEGLTDPDDAPEPPETPITAPGDIWRCGKHRVLCGDCTVATDVDRLLGSVTPLLMVTDPPYGVEYDADWRNHTGMARAERAIGKVQNDDNADWHEAWALFPGDVGYIWHAGNKAHIVAESIEASGMQIRAQIIWAKNNIVIGRGHYHPKHEPCWYAVRKGAKGHWNGDRKQSTVWDIDKPMKSETGHSTQKPVECMRRPIVNNSAPGQPVYDPFLGSGTTMIAAEMEGRQCLGLEIDPVYVDVIVQRWQNFTGEKATLDGDGRCFDELAEERREAA